MMMRLGAMVYIISVIQTRTIDRQILSARRNAMYVCKVTNSRCMHVDVVSLAPDAVSEASAAD
jgi:hypothetical protein